MHRTLLAQPPLESVQPGDLSSIKNPRICLISLPRSSMITVGPFEQVLDSLITENGMEVPEVPEDRIIIPCLSRQLPAIVQHFGPSVAIISSVVLYGRAQASLRTISLSTSRVFHYDLKFALACNISSALRTITPWTALIRPEVSSILDKVLPSDMWMCHEIAAATGSDANFDKAKHCSVLIRENLEAKARARGETLIVSAALAERGVDSEFCHAERVFGLQSEAQKEIWFRQSVIHSQQCKNRPHLPCANQIIRCLDTLPNCFLVLSHLSTNRVSVLKATARIS